RRQARPEWAVRPYNQDNLRLPDGGRDMLTVTRANAWMKQAQECEGQHRLTSAIDAYEHAARSPDGGTAATANYCLGRLYEQRHRYTSAVKAYRRAANCLDLALRTSANYHL